MTSQGAAAAPFHVELSHLQPVGRAHFFAWFPWWLHKVTAGYTKDNQETNHSSTYGVFRTLIGRPV
jgi:hypothetical protein